MMQILPGDHLWERYLVERVEPAATATAWLSNLADEPSHFLLLSLDRPYAGPLHELLAAVAKAMRRSEKRSADGSGRCAAQRIPLLGDVEWFGGAAVVEVPPGAVLSHVHNAGPFTPAQALWLLRRFSESIRGFLEFCGSSQEILRPLAQLLQWETVCLRHSDSRIILCARKSAGYRAEIPPPETGLLAPEFYRGEALSETALVFETARIIALMMSGPSQPDSSWVPFADWAAGRRDPAREFLRDTMAAGHPAALRTLMARALAKTAARRHPSVARLLTRAKEMEAESWAHIASFCPCCGLPLNTALQPALCPSCNFDYLPLEAPPNTKSRRTSAVLRKNTALAKPNSLLSLPQGMTLIEAGSFLSGERKLPRTLRTFAIDTVPVTEKAYKDYLAASGQKPRKDGPGSRSAEFDQHPVTGTTWYEATAFCEFYGKRLPTIYEWEKAARGLDGRKFPFGDSLKPDCGRMRAIKEQEGKSTAPVGSYAAGASPFGVMDMAGNVLEWTCSARRAGERLFRAVKGACYMDGSSELARCTSVQYFPPESSEPYLGFRCVKDVE